MDWASSVIEALDATAVEPAVRRLLDSPDARVTSVAASPIDYTNVDPDARLLMRVDGVANDSSGDRPWSLVLKGFRRVEGSGVDIQDHFDYWEREPGFFESGAWAELPDGVRSVRPFGVDRRAPDEIWVWLEALTDDHPEGWPLERFELAARHLGRFGGAYLAGHPVPTTPWLASTREVQRHFSIEHPEISEAVLPALESPPLTPGGEPFASASDRVALRQTFARQAELLDAVDAAPRALCHNDCMAANLFAGHASDGSPETIVIDWQLVGIGPVGGDLGQLVPGSAVWFRVPVDDLDALDRRCFEAYLAGIEDVGAVIEPTTIRLASLTTTLAQWTGIVAIHLVTLLDPRDSWVDGFWRRPRGEVIEQLVPLLSFLARRAREATEMLDA